MNEQWKDIPEFEGWYQVSDAGRVRRVAKWPPSRTGQVLAAKPCGRDRQYRQVSLSVDGKVSYHSIHRLVMLAFVGPCPEGKNVNHKDGDKGNNVLGNLEYVTPAENTYHAIASGLMLPAPPVLRGEKANRSKLTADQVREIRSLYKPHEFGAYRLAKMYGVSKQSIRAIVNRKSWAHV